MASLKEEEEPLINSYESKILDVWYSIQSDRKPLGEGLVSHIPTTVMIEVIRIYNFRDVKMAYELLKYLDSVAVELVNGPAYKALEKQRKKIESQGRK